MLSVAEYKACGTHPERLSENSGSNLRNAGQRCEAGVFIRPHSPRICRQQSRSDAVS
jgi:hypothetical protein